jgi:hypothetical protein
MLGEGDRARECGSSPARPSDLSGRACHLCMLAAARGGQWGRALQDRRQSLLCPDSLRGLSVPMGRLVAELPVIVSAIALDMDAAHTVPQFKGLLIFTWGSLAAAPACGLQQRIVRDSRGLIE